MVSQLSLEFAVSAQRAWAAVFSVAVCGASPPVSGVQRTSRVRVCMGWRALACPLHATAGSWTLLPVSMCGVGVLIGKQRGLSSG
jgi:hypothetical protein